ncbi:putative disease resistance protein RGA3 [Musa acuminata AAA Group]|uniref:putative disease resistance protein RGA3 n=1 Tax=Musa acuminata AAA Group TaxID=214697 RepID=UPI0031D6D6E9
MQPEIHRPLNLQHHHILTTIIMVVEALLSSFLEILIGSTKNSVVRQIGGVWGLEEDLEKLERTLLRIQSIVGDAEEQQIKDTAVKNWLTALRDAAYAAEDVLDDFNLETLRKSNRAIENKMMGKVSDFFSSHNPLCFRFKMARKLTEVVKSIDEIVAESRKFNFAVRTQEQTPPTVRQTHSYVVESDVIGRGEEKDEIVKLLIEQQDENEKIAVLPIVGMGGLGKTTLAKLIYQDKRVERHFQLRIWVCVGSVFDLGEILKAIISSATGRQSDLKFMDMLQCSVRDVLAGKRYLLVLDDVWNEDSSKWDDLKALLACGGDGSRVVVTTRSDGVSSMMGTLTTHKLAFLSEEDSWDLFRRRAFPSGEDDDKQQHQNLVEIGKAIVTKCGGLPLAVKALGSMLSYQNDEREWSAIKESNIWDTKVGEGDILPALLLSYNDLPSHLKRCFAFCAIFPKDYEIEVDMLIRLWMGQGFIPSEGTAEPEVKGHRIFMELHKRCFFQDVRRVKERRYIYFLGNIMRDYFRWRNYELEVEGYCSLRTCKMHDLIRDLAQHISGEEGVALLEPCTATAPKKNVHHLSSPGTSSSYKIHETLGKFPALRTLLVRDAYFGKAVDNISRPAKLRVLGFHNLNATMLLNLAQHLKHVRFLDISYSKIAELPEAITTLLNLQTLKLSGCQLLRKLPSKMKNMCNLRHLYLDECTELRDMPEGLGRLSCLHTLSKYIVGVGAGRGIGQLKELNLSGKLEIYGLGKVRDAANAREANLHSKRDLHSLSLCWGVVEWTEKESLSENVETRAENSEVLLEALAPPDGIKALSIWGYGGVRFPTWTSDEQLLSRYQLLVEIHLGGCRNCQHLPSFWQLPSLEVLCLKHMYSLKHIIRGEGGGDCREQTFPALKRLVLEGMPSLEQWWEVEGGGAVEEGKCFPHLVELRISECSKLGSMPRLPSLKFLGMPSGNRMLGSIENLSTLACPLDLR